MITTITTYFTHTAASIAAFFAHLGIAMGTIAFTALAVSVIASAGLGLYMSRKDA